MVKKVLLFVGFVVAVMAVNAARHESPNAETVDIDPSSSAISSPEPDVVTPNDQAKLIEIVSKYRKSFLNAETSLARSNARSEGLNELCSFMGSLKFAKNWQGHILDVRSDYSVLIDLDPLKKSNHKVVAILGMEPTDDAKSKALLMKSGQNIEFSGTVLQFPYNPDCNSLFQWDDGRDIYTITIDDFRNRSLSSVPIHIQLDTATFRDSY